MTPPNGVAPASSAPPISPDPDPKAPEAKKENTSNYNQFEIRVGARTGVGDTFQGNAGVAYLPLPWLSLGLDFNSNFSSKPISVLFKPGYRFRLSDQFSIQPTAVVGGGYLNDREVVGGRLAEKATLSGGFWAAGGEVQFQYNPTQWLGFYLAPGFLHEGNGGTTASPEVFAVSREDPRSSSNIFMVNFGASFGVAPKPYKSSAEENKDETSEGTKKPAGEDPKISEMKIDQRVNARVAAIKESLEKDKAEKFEKAIGKVQTRINEAKAFQGHVTAGINRTNQMGKGFDESLDYLARNPKKPLASDKKEAIKAHLTALITATETNNPDKSDLSEDIRTGLRFIYPLSTTKNRYGLRILYQLKKLKEELKTHKETELAEQVDQAIVKVQKYLDERPEPIQMNDLNHEVTSLQSTTDSLEAMGTEYELSDNESWMALKADLRTLKDDVAFMTRQADALANFGSILNGPTNFFGDQMDAPERAKNTMETALKFLADMPKSDRYKDVTLDLLKKSYADYFNFLAYNLNIFISMHTPPELKNAAKRREWFPAVEKARELLCTIDSSHPQCVKPLEKPPKAPPPTVTPPPAAPPPSAPPPAAPPPSAPPPVAPPPALPPLPKDDSKPPSLPPLPGKPGGSGTAKPSAPPLPKPPKDD